VSFDFRTVRSVLVAPLAAILMTGSLVPAGAARAADDKPFIEYRQKVMSAIGANMGAIADILKNGLPFTGNIEQHAANMEGSAKLIAPAFEKKTTGGATDAKPDIWTDWSEFQRAVRNYQQAAFELEEAADGGDMAKVGAKMKALGKTCGDCHKAFRKPKEESYKRK